MTMARRQVTPDPCSIQSPSNCAPLPSFCTLFDLPDVLDVGPDVPDVGQVEPQHISRGSVAVFGRVDATTYRSFLQVPTFSVRVTGVGATVNVCRA